MSAQPRQILMDLLSPVVEGSDGFLEDIEVRTAGRRTLVRLIVDRDGGIDLDDVARLSRAMSEVLDAREGELPFGEYVLEVSSPGVDRPLTQPRHFQRNIGRLLSITDNTGGQFTGRLTSFADDVATLQLKSGDKAFALSDIAKARVEVEFNPGSGKAAPANPSEGEDVLTEYVDAGDAPTSSQARSKSAGSAGGRQPGSHHQNTRNQPRKQNPRNKQGGSR